MLPLHEVAANRYHGWSEDTTNSTETSLSYPLPRPQVPSRQPLAPPNDPAVQNDQGFAQFLKKHASPTHQRVTAAGKIVPMEPRPQQPQFVPVSQQTVPSSKTGVGVGVNIGASSVTPFVHGNGDYLQKVNIWSQNAYRSRGPVVQEVLERPLNWASLTDSTRNSDSTSANATKSDSNPSRNATTITASGSNDSSTCHQQYPAQSRNFDRKYMVTNPVREVHKDTYMQDQTGIHKQSIPASQYSGDQSTHPPTDTANVQYPAVMSPYLMGGSFMPVMNPYMWPVASSGYPSFTNAASFVPPSTGLYALPANGSLWGYGTNIPPSNLPFSQPSDAIVIQQRQNDHLGDIEAQYNDLSKQLADLDRYTAAERERMTAEEKNVCVARRRAIVERRAAAKHSMNAIKATEKLPSRQHQTIISRPASKPVTIRAPGTESGSPVRLNVQAAEWSPSKDVGLQEQSRASATLSEPSLDIIKPAHANQAQSFAETGSISRTFQPPKLRTRDLPVVTSTVESPSHVLGNPPNGDARSLLDDDSPVDEWGVRCAQAPPEVHREQKKLNDRLVAMATTNHRQNEFHSEQKRCLPRPSAYHFSLSTQAARGKSTFDPRSEVTAEGIIPSQLNAAYESGLPSYYNSKGIDLIRVKSPCSVATQDINAVSRLYGHFDGAADLGRRLSNTPKASPSPVKSNGCNVPSPRARRFGRPWLSSAPQGSFDSADERTKLIIKSLSAF